MAPVEFRDLSKRFAGVAAVEDLSFDIEAGRVTGFLGPNGAGKSTTLRALLGLVRPSSGSATFDGQRYDELAQPAARVGAVLEDASFHPGRTARNHLRILAATGGLRAGRVDEVLAAVDLGAAADRRVKGFSMGMRQRLAIAAALLGDPQVLILDEPTNGLDPPGITWLRGLLREQAAGGRAVLISSHVLAEVAQSVHDGEVVGSVPAEHLADAPVYERDVRRPAYLDEVQKLDVAALPQPQDYNATLLRMLAHPNLCSRRSIFEQYDHEVGTDTVVAPGADAAVLRIKGSKLGFAVTTDGRGRHCYLDPRGGGAATVATAYRNLSCVGAEPVAVTDCLNSGTPEKPDAYYQLAACVEGMAEACEALGTPVVSGNVSLYNETDAGAVYPTPVVGMVGVFGDVSRHATPSFKREGDEVVSLGRLWQPSLAGSDYLEIIHGKVAGAPVRL